MSFVEPKNEQQIHISIQDNIVTKKSLPQLMEIEVEKTKKALKIATECGLFRVPKVIDFNNETGEAKFERIPNIKSFRSILKNQTLRKNLIERIGKSLSIIHNELKLSSDMRIPIDKKWAGPDKSNVFIHGDFNIMNVHCNVEANDIWIIDWQMTDLWGGRATYGSRYYDISWFLQTVFHHLPFELPSGWIKHFFISYFSQSNYPYNEYELKTYLHNVWRNWGKSYSIFYHPERYLFQKITLLYFKLYIKRFSIGKKTSP